MDWGSLRTSWVTNQTILQKYLVEEKKKQVYFLHHNRIANDNDAINIQVWEFQDLIVFYVGILRRKKENQNNPRYFFYCKQNHLQVTFDRDRPQKNEKGR